MNWLKIGRLHVNMAEVKYVELFDSRAYVHFDPDYNGENEKGVLIFDEPEELEILRAYFDRGA